MGKQRAAHRGAKTVCFFSGDITRAGGTERTSIMLANALAAQGKYRILFLSLVEQAKQPFFELDGEIPHFALGDKWIVPGLGYLKVIPKVRRFLKEQQVDVVVDIDIVLDSLSVPAARGLGVKVVSWEHFNYGYEMESWYRRAILKHSVKRSDHIVTLTIGDKEAYMRETGRERDISAIHNPMPKIAGGETPSKEKWLITAGHLIPRKGIDYLAQVARQVLRQFSDWKWLVVGSGEERGSLEGFIRDNQLEGQLILTGRVEDVNDYLRRAQICVMTSREEGLPMSLLEAKAHSLPCVSFDIPTGPNEIIKDGVNGYLIDPFDCDAMAEKLAQLMGNEGLRREFAAHAQDDMEAFQMESVLGDWNRLLGHITADGDEGK